MLPQFLIIKFWFKIEFSHKQKRHVVAGSCSHYSTFSASLAKKKAILAIYNDDNLCMARALALGIVNCLYGHKTMELAVADPDGKQHDLACAILKSAGISTKLKSYNLKHLDKIQQSIDKKLFRLVVFHGEKGLKIVYKGKPAKFTIPLLFHGKHFDLVLSPKKLMRVNFNFLSFAIKKFKILFKTKGEFCYDCESVVYSNSHKLTGDCIACCYLCFRFGFGFPCMPRTGQNAKQCSDCGFFFPNANCFEFHRRRGKRGGLSICEQRYYCRKCSKIVSELWKNN